MEEIVNWKTILFLISVISAGIVYWRKSKDKADEYAENEIKRIETEARKSRSEIYNHIDKNQKTVIEKLDEVLEGQHKMDVKMEKAFMHIDQHAKDIERITKKQDEGLKDLGKFKEFVNGFQEWKKRIEEKLKL